MGKSAIGPTALAEVTQGWHCLGKYSSQMDKHLRFDFHTKQKQNELTKVKSVQVAALVSRSIYSSFKQ